MYMSENLLAALVVGILLTAHFVVGALSWRYHAGLRYLPWLNFVTAGGVVVYWMQRWYGVLVHGIRWYGTDQLLPAYALVVCVVSVLAISRQVKLVPLHWTVFAAHLIVLIGAAVFMVTFKMDRLF
jgi:hypothetical protein